MRKSTPILIASTISVALMLGGCASTPESEGASVSPTVKPEVSVAPTDQPSADPTESSVDRPTADTISCDTMLDPLVDKALRSTKLIPAGKPWTQFGFEPTGAALECPWGYEGQNHSVTYYAWAALSEGEGEQFLALTRENGYTSMENEQGTWVAGSGNGPADATAILVTDEWIAFAPTPELVPAIVWTR